MSQICEKVEFTFKIIYLNGCFQFHKLHLRTRHNATLRHRWLYSIGILEAQMAVLSNDKNGDFCNCK